MKISVIIPCIPSHLRYLEQLCKELYNGTKTPYEIIVALCYYEKCDQNYLDSLKEKFSIKFICNIGKISPGKNRNIGSKEANGDIYMYLDADDIVHPKKLEIVDYFFSNMDIVHLCHYFLPLNTELPEYENIQNISYYPLSNTTKLQSGKLFFNGLFESIPYHTISCIRNIVFEKVQYPDLFLNEDNLFCKDIINTFNKTIMVEAFLMNYNNCFIDKYKKAFPDYIKFINPITLNTLPTCLVIELNLKHICSIIENLLSGMYIPDYIYLFFKDEFNQDIWNSFLKKYGTCQRWKFLNPYLSKLNIDIIPNKSKFSKMLILQIDDDVIDIHKINNYFLEI